MIPESERANIVMSSIVFIRAVTKAYGSEEGMELWSRIAEVLDPAIKGEVFKAMITGEFNGIITVSGIDQQRFKKIDFVKLIRSVDKRGLTLKEALNVTNRLEEGLPFGIEVSESNRQDIILQLQSLGVYL